MLGAKSVILAWWIEVAETFADSLIFLQIFGGVEDTHKTLVKKASQKGVKKEEEEGRDEDDDRRSSSVYDSRSSLRRWIPWIDVYLTCARITFDKSTNLSMVISYWLLVIGDWLLVTCWLILPLVQWDGGADLMCISYDTGSKIQTSV